MKIFAGTVHRIEHYDNNRLVAVRRLSRNMSLEEAADIFRSLQEDEDDGDVSLISDEE